MAHYSTIPGAMSKDLLNLNTEPENYTGQIKEVKPNYRFLDTSLM